MVKAPRGVFKFVVALALLPIAARAAELGFVVNSVDATISVIDMKTHEQVRTVPAVREPHHITLSPDGHVALIGDTVANLLLFMDPATGNIIRKVPISDPYQLIFSPDGKYLTISGLARNQVDIYDAASLRLLHRIPAKAMPSHIGYSPDSSVAYVTLQETGRLIAIQLSTGDVLWNVPVGNTPAGVLWHSGRILVGIMGENGVAEIDPADGSRTGFIVTGRGAHNLFYSPDRKLLYVSNRVDSTLTALDAATLKTVRTYKVPGGPDDIDFAPDGTIWITQRFHHGLLFLDPNTGTFSRIDVGRSPHGLWLNTDGPLRISDAK